MSVVNPPQDQKTEKFDPYYIWLGIPPQQRPIDYYVLLGLHQFEKNTDVIQQAADRQMAHLRTFQNGEHVKLSQKLLNEVAKARNCLLNKERKRSYDNTLRVQLNERRRPKQEEVETTEQQDSEVADVAVTCTTAAIPSESSARIPPVRAAKPREPQAAPPRTKPAKVQTNETAVEPKSNNRRRWMYVGVVAASLFLVSTVGAVMVWLSTADRSIAQRIDAAQQSQTQSQSAPSSVSHKPNLGGGKDKPAPRPAAKAPNLPVAASTPSRVPLEAPKPIQSPRVEVKPTEVAAAPTVSPVQTTASPELPPGFTDEGNESVAKADQSANEDVFADLKATDDKANDVQKPSDADAKGGQSAATAEGQPTPADNGAIDKKDAPSSKLAIPGPKIQQEVEAIARDTFRKELNDSRTPEQRSALAKRFLETGLGYPAGEPARYVMLMNAANLAAEVGNGELLVQAIDNVGAEYEIDVVARLSELLERSGKSRLPPTGYDSVSRAMIAVVERAMAADRLEIARDLVTSARAVAVKTKNRALLIQVNDLNTQVRDQAIRFAEVRKALLVLGHAPDDPKENFVVGTYRCFVKGDWQAGLPHLARCNDKDLADMAKRSLTPPAEPPRIVELGDRWWDRASAAPEREQQQQLIWACHLYKLALPRVQGLMKTKLDKRIAEVEKGAKK